MCTVNAVLSSHNYLAKITQVFCITKYIVYYFKCDGVKEIPVGSTGKCKKKPPRSGAGGIDAYYSVCYFMLGSDYLRTLTLVSSENLTTLSPLTK